MSAHVFSSALFTRLQSHAEPFVDTIEDVISRALDALDSSAHKPSSTLFSPAQNDTEVQVYDASSPPNLTHTTLRWFSVANKDPEEIHWGALVAAAIRQAALVGASPEKIIAAMSAPARPGSYDGPGYRFVKDANVSFQQLNSDRSWQQADRLARKFGFSIKVRWTWSGNEKSHAPNGSGAMSVEA